jgi:KaiC/GvpD/RAD55 family RecA-like ATPase
MSTIHVDIPGLDLVLGGGIPAISRAEGLEESATLLLRGPPGSGKSIFGTQIAAAIGRTLGVDVAYGCVELLPHELHAQHGAFGPVGDRVVVPPFARQEPPKQGECRIFAAVLDIGSAEEAQSSFGGAVIELLEVVEACGGKPRVLVIDSLSDGYKLGSSAPRELADRLCKLAASRGMFLVMLEETEFRSRHRAGAGDADGGSAARHAGAV